LIGRNREVAVTGFIRARAEIRARRGEEAIGDLPGAALQV
jgi:hypothetical protein